MDRSMTRGALLRRGLYLEYATLGWNVAGVVIVLAAAIATRSVALAGFGLDSLIEILASVIVIWQLTGADQHREQRALRLIGGTFFALAVYILGQETLALGTVCGGATFLVCVAHGLADLPGDVIRRLHMQAGRSMGDDAVPDQHNSDKGSHGNASGGCRCDGVRIGYPGTSSFATTRWATWRKASACGESV